MDNQQAYHIYCTHEANGRYYLGFTKTDKPKSSYTDRTYQPHSKQTLQYTNNIVIAKFIEHGLQVAWSAHKSSDFANLAIQPLTGGFNLGKHSADAKTKMSETHKKINSAAHLNVPEVQAKSLETRLKNKSQAGEKNSMYGKKHSDATKLKQAEKRKEWWSNNADHKPNLGNKHSAKAKAKISLASKKSAIKRFQRCLLLNKNYNGTGNLSLAKYMQYKDRLQRLEAELRTLQAELVYQANGNGKTEG